MSGNVQEWTWDWWAPAYPPGVLVYPTGPDSGEYRVRRGGSWVVVASICTVAYRLFNYPNYRSNSVGFRVVSR